MTREKAIERLKEGAPFNEIYYPDWEESLAMAIKALEQEPCEDAVSRNAVKDKLIRLWNTSADEDYKFETLRDYIVDLPSVTPTKTEPKWISVDERLPENFQRVLVTIVNYNGNKVVRVAEYIISQRIFRVLENHDLWEVGEKGLLAWRPLPEPYKAESEET